ERAFAEGWVIPRPPATRSGRTVVVVGGGMVGLAAAAALNQAGHYVRVYESSSRLGGLLSVGAGLARVEQWVVDRRVRLLEAEGVEIVTGAKIGETLGFDEIREVSDALILTVGKRRPRRLRVPGVDTEGVFEADRLLRRRDHDLDARGQRVLILGDGEGADTVRRRAEEGGARAVSVFPLLGRGIQAALDRRPEGAWPLLHSDGGGSPQPVVVVAIEADDAGSVRSVRLVKVGLEEERGWPVVVPQPGTAFSVEAERVILAPGFVGPDTRLIERQLGVELDVDGNIAADRRFGTSVPGVFYAGHANPGASELLWDLSQGLEVAAEVDVRVRGGSSEA
ncbi:MAG: FAD-dependent oxidoreductase, partial [Myxococcota bacterium]